MVYLSIGEMNVLNSIINQCSILRKMILSGKDAMSASISKKILLFIYLLVNYC